MTTPLVLLHGYALSPLAWARTVEALRRNLSFGCDVVALPLPGHAPTIELSVAADFAAAVDLLATTLPEVPSHVVGYSLGGRLTLGLIERHPAKVLSATLIGAHPGLTESAERQERSRIDAAWSLLLRREGIDAFVRAWEQQPIFQSQHTVSRDEMENLRRLRLAHDAEQLARAMDAMSLARMPDFRPMLLQTATPVQWISGDADDKFTKLSQTMQRLMRNASHTVLPCGHNPLLEAPELLAEAIAQRHSRL